MKPVIFDNEGATLDRYTIIMPNGEMYGASTIPFAPQGFAQYCGNIAHNYYGQTVGHAFINRIEQEDKKHYNKLIKQATKEQIAIARKDNDWLGKEVKINELPADVQHYINRL